MIFKKGDRVVVVQIDNFKFALPNEFDNFKDMLKQTLRANGHNFEYCGSNVMITDVIENPQKIDRFGDHKDYVCESLAITEQSYVARESRALLEKLGVKVFINESPKLFKDLFIMMDEKDNKIYAMEELTSGYRLIDQCSGYFVDNHTFSCELGTYTYKSA